MLPVSGIGTSHPSLHTQPNTIIQYFCNTAGKGSRSAACSWSFVKIVRLMIDWYDCCIQLHTVVIECYTVIIYTIFIYFHLCSIIFHYLLAAWCHRLRCMLLDSHGCRNGDLRAYSCCRKRVKAGLMLFDSFCCTAPPAASKFGMLRLFRLEMIGRYC